jgi:hypothetical protein
MISGSPLFARYAFPPNERGLCGPPDNAALRGYAAAGLTDPDLRRLAGQFEGAWPYLRLIAEANGITDPLDRQSSRRTGSATACSTTCWWPSTGRSSTSDSAAAPAAASVHWNSVCDRLSPSPLRALRHYSARHLRFANAADRQADRSVC